MADVRIPRIDEFPKDGRFWRVDWFGALEPNPQVTTEPFFQVIISPFYLDPFSLPPDKLSSVTVTDPDQQKEVRVGIGQLPLIDIGSIWLDGVHQGIYAGVSEEFCDLQINAQTVQIVSAVHKENGLNIIPYRYYRVGKAGAGSLLVAVEYNGDPYCILIPAIELIRFYYAVSTNLAHALFSGALLHNPDSIINTDRTWFRAEDDRVFLGLRQHVTDEEGWVLARILYSKVAAEACREIYDSVIKDVINKKFIHVASSFPFVGNTNLRARVKRLKSSDGSRWRSLVLSLEYCTAPMPYSELTVIRDNDGGQSSSETDIPQDRKRPYVRGSTSKNAESDLALQSEKGTNPALSNVVLTVASNRFGVLEGRSPDKPTKEQCEYRSGGLSRNGFEVEALGTGLGGYGENEQEIQQVNIAPERNRKKAAAPSFELFVAAVEHLSREEGVSASIRQVGSELAYMPLSKPSRRWQWGYLDSAAEQRRKVIVADISMDGRHFNLIEFQQRERERCTVCLASAGKRKLVDSDLYRLLVLCSSKNGVWKNIDEEGVNIVALKHTWSDALSFRNSVVSRMLF